MFTDSNIEELEKLVVQHSRGQFGYINNRKKNALGEGGVQLKIINISLKVRQKTFLRFAWITLSGYH